MSGYWGPLGLGWWDTTWDQAKKLSDPSLCALVDWRRFQAWTG